MTDEKIIQGQSEKLFPSIINRKEILKFKSDYLRHP